MHVQQMGNPPGPVQEARAGIEYQTIAGVPDPAAVEIQRGGLRDFQHVAGWLHGRPPVVAETCGKAKLLTLK